MKREKGHITGCYFLRGGKFCVSQGKLLSHVDQLYFAVSSASQAYSLFIAVFGKGITFSGNVGNYSRLSKLNGTFLSLRSRRFNFCGF